MTFEKGQHTGALGLNEIQQILPHRDPFLMLDAVESCEAGVRITATKHVRAEEDYFRGHFPGNPVMPGVLQLEALAQAGAVCVLLLPRYTGKLAFFGGCNNVHFRRIVRPGDTLRLEITIERLLGMAGRGSGTAYVGDEIACQADIMFMIGG